jgi:hypothetical protein
MKKHTIFSFFSFQLHATLRKKTAFLLIIIAFKLLKIWPILLQPNQPNQHSTSTSSVFIFSWHNVRPNGCAADNLTLMKTRKYHLKPQIWKIHRDLREGKNISWIKFCFIFRVDLLWRNNVLGIVRKLCSGKNHSHSFPVKRGRFSQFGRIKEVFKYPRKRGPKVRDF